MRILLIEDEPLLGEAVAAHLHKLHAVDWMQSRKRTWEARMDRLDAHLRRRGEHDQ